MTQTFRIDDQRQTLVLAIVADGLPMVAYWGRALPASEDLATIHAAQIPDITGGMLDETPPLTLCPDPRGSWQGQPGLTLRDGAGAPLLPRWRFAGADQRGDGLTLTCRDDAAGLTLQFDFAADPASHIITCQTRLRAQTAVWVDWLCAPALPAPQLADEMIDFAGRWCGEFQMQRTPWSAGIRLRDNRTGRSGHEHFPALILPCRGARNTAGEVFALHYGWSGGHRMIAEELPDGRRAVQFGHAAGTHTAPSTDFVTAPLYLAYSAAGLNGCARAFQRHLRDRIVTWPHPQRPRPVHYNCWEAVYFDHSLPVLRDIATRAAALGAERFVLDDGWFGARDDDTSSLGDWQVDARKYPEGLHPLIAHIHSLGMTFGLWFEPEMVNDNSDICRAHPTWVLGDAGQVLGRQQKVLDMANAAVRDYLYDKIAAILAEYPIDYIKWDHNRVLPQPDAAQTYGSYALLDRLRAAFPAVEIESCASGGGRIDFGIMARTQRVWLSDSNDALERLRIQHDAALFLPLAVTGSHVGPRHCHTSGRVLDMALRAWVAAQRHMGFEMDPRELTDAEAAILRHVTTWWQANREWMARADILRLDSADTAVIAEQQMAEDDSRFVVFAGKAATSAQIIPRPLRLTALEAGAQYRITLTNRDSAVGLSRGAPLLKSADMVVSGAYLMQQGVTLPWSFPAQIWVLEGVRL